MTQFVVVVGKIDFNKSDPSSLVPFFVLFCFPTVGWHGPHAQELLELSKYLAFDIIIFINPHYCYFVLASISDGQPCNL